MHLLPPNMHLARSQASLPHLARFGTAGEKNAAWAVEKLLDKVGVSAGLMGTPKLEADDREKMILIVSQMSDAAKVELKGMAQNKQLSDYNSGRPKILPENFERKLIEYLDI